MFDTVRTSSDMWALRGGVLKVVTGIDPAAGSEVTDAVPAGKLWLVYGVQVVLVTDANAANRTVELTWDDGTDVYGRTASQITHAASLTRTYVWSPSSVTTNAGSVSGVIQQVLPTP